MKMVTPAVNDPITLRADIGTKSEVRANVSRLALAAIKKTSSNRNAL